jgi:hypothetical protein
MNENPYEPPKDSQKSPPEKQPSARESGNRLTGLLCYAGAVVLIGLLALGIHDDLKSHGMAGVKQDLSNLALFAGGALVLAGIGFTTGRRSR